MEIMIIGGGVLKVDGNSYKLNKELIDLISESKSLNIDEKQSWINNLDNMNDYQLDELMNILIKERRDILNLDIKYQNDIKEIELEFKHYKDELNN